jgi:hypothetical protein
LILVSFLRFTVVAQTTNTGTVGESVAAESFDNGIIVFYTWEGDIDVDLNGDGDKEDDVIRYYNVSSGGTTNTTAVGYEPAIRGNIIAFLTDEWSLGEDLNNDTDTDDTVIRYYDIASGVTNSTGEIGYDVAVDNGIITFTVSEWGIGEDLNHDGDSEDRFVWYYDVSTGLTFNATTILGAYASKDGNIIAFETWEEWDSIDLNGDGDTIDPVIRYYNMSTETITNTTAVGHEVSVNGNTIAFYTFEGDVNEDLNGDGDKDDPIVRYHDILSGNVTNTGAFGEFPSVEGNIIAFETWESDFGEDLDGDGNLDDTVIRYCDISTGAVVNTTAVGNYASVDSNVIAFETYESSLGTDLNGDGDTNDSVVRYYKIPWIHQGDLVLTDNDVYIIEGMFDINGSIIVEENATLILRNALLNFMQVTYYQFNMTFQNPLNGNPRLMVEHASISTGGYPYMQIYFYGNSSAEINKLSTTSHLNIWLFDNSSVTMANSTLEGSGLWAFHNCVVVLSNCSFYGVGGSENARLATSNCTVSSIGASGGINFTALNCTINIEVHIQTQYVDYSITGLEPGFISYWNFISNCSAVGITVPDLTLEDTQVAGWSFESRGYTNANMSSSKLYIVTFFDRSHGYLYNMTIERLDSYGYSEVHGFDSMANTVRSYGNSRIWAVNSTTNSIAQVCDNSVIYVSWYLDVHVIDSIVQNVPSANVTATYPNATIAESKLTNENGWTRLTLMQMMINSTGYYPVGDYNVNATYLTYSNETIVDMTGSKQISLMLEGFVISEFPSQIILPLFIIATLLTVIIRKRKLFHKAKT